jgi:hypothetical protein
LKRALQLRQLQKATAVAPLPPTLLPVDKKGKQTLPTMMYPYPSGPLEMQGALFGLEILIFIYKLAKEGLTKCAPL